MASRNQSNNEKTVKTTLLTMQNDFWTIDNVSLYCNYLNKAILPDGFILDEYRDYFENFLVEVNVSEDYYYSPSMFSEAQYGTPDLDFLIMYFAKISSLFEFNQPKIKILPLSSLTDLNKLIVQNKFNIRQSKTNPTTYNKLSDIILPSKGYIDEGINIITTKSNLRKINVGEQLTIVNSKLGMPTPGEINDLPDVVDETNNTYISGNTPKGGGGNTVDIKPNRDLNILDM
jgi:hypothetical protein